jgi:hypothetical protein
MAALKQHQLFLAHAWTKADNADALQLAEFLDRAPHFKWANLASHEASAPDNDQARKRDLQERIRYAQCLVLPVAVYLKAKAWARFQIQCAKDANIPIVAVKPADGKVVPFEIQTDTAEVVGWSPKEIATAIRNAIKEAPIAPAKAPVTQSRLQQATATTAKTAAQRQALCRAKRHSNGADGNGQHQLSTWLDTRAALALERIAKRDAVTKRQVLERLILEEDQRNLPAANTTKLTTNLV